MKNLFKVPVGDWSKDGHNEYKNYYVTCNYAVEDMQQAYKDTCKKIGLQLNHNEDYTGIGEILSYGSEDKWRLMLTEYEESTIDDRAVTILKEHGFESEQMDEGYFDEEAVFNLFMWFISYSLPENFEWEEVVPEATPLVGWWGNLNHQIGYGVYG